MECGGLVGCGCLVWRLMFCDCCCSVAACLGAFVFLLVRWRIVILLEGSCTYIPLSFPPAPSLLVMYITQTLNNRHSSPHLSPFLLTNTLTVKHIVSSLDLSDSRTGGRLCFDRHVLRILLCAKAARLVCSFWNSQMSLDRQRSTMLAFVSEAGC